MFALIYIWLFLVAVYFITFGIDYYNLLVQKQYKTFFKFFGVGFIIGPIILAADWYKKLDSEN